MQYKYSFTQYEGIPVEYIEREKLGQMNEGIDKIGRDILKHYEYEEEGQGFSAQSVYTLELVVTSAEKYHNAVNYIRKLLSFHPDLQSEVLRALEDAQAPDIEP